MRPVVAAASRPAITGAHGFIANRFRTVTVTDGARHVMSQAAACICNVFALSPVHNVHNVLSVHSAPYYITTTTPNCSEIHYYYSRTTITNTATVVAAAMPTRLDAQASLTPLPPNNPLSSLNRHCLPFQPNYTYTI